MALSRNPELWQSLPAEKRHDLKNSSEFTAIEEEVERLPFELKDNPVVRDRRRKELYIQKRERTTQVPKYSAAEIALEGPEAGADRIPSLSVL